MSNGEVADFVLAHRIGSASEIKATTEALLDECLHKGSRDNMSAIICALPAATQRTAGGGGDKAAAATATVAGASAASASGAGSAAWATASAAAALAPPAAEIPT